MGATATGLDGIIRAAEDRARRARDLSPALRVAAEAVKLAIEDSFRTRTDFNGQPFAPNARATIKKKGSSKPLRDTGDLEQSISASPVGRDTIRFGTNKVYAGPVISGFTRSGTLKHNSYGESAGKYRRKRREGPRAGAFRPAGTPWTVTTPGRNPFPVSPRGQWLGSQRASALLNKVGRIASDYIMRGRL